MLIRISAAALMAMLVCAPLAHGQSKTESKAAVEEELKKLDRAWLDAEKRLDVDYCEKFFADGYVLVFPNGQMLTKKEWLGVLRGPEHPTITLLDPENIQVHLFGNVAILTDHTTLKGRDGKGNSMDGEFNVFRVVTKQNGAWRATGVVMNAVAPQK